MPRLILSAYPCIDSPLRSRLKLEQTAPRPVSPTSPRFPSISENIAKWKLKALSFKHLHNCSSTIFFLIVRNFTCLAQPTTYILVNL